MERKGMKKEGAIGLILIAIIVVVAVLGFRPKGLESALGGGFDPANVAQVTITLTPAAGGDPLTATLAGNGEEFAHLLAVLQDPSYSRTNTKDDQITLDYLVDITFTDGAEGSWSYHCQGGKLMQAGVTDNLKTYQISDGQTTQQKILDYCLTLTE